MKNDSSLAVLEKSVSLPGAGVTKTALLINERATEKEIADLGAALVHIDGSRSWWLGDYGLFIQKRKRAEVAKLNPDLDPETLSLKGTEYLKEKAEVMGIDSGTLSNYASVCRYFKKPCRNGNLTFSHHWEAMQAKGADLDPEVANKWLGNAEIGGWSVSQLRARIREQAGTAKRPELKPLPNDWEPIDELDGWIQREVKELDFTPDYARSQLVRFANIIAFIEKLKELAK